MDVQSVPADQREQIEERWTDVPDQILVEGGGNRLERLAASFAVADPRAAELVKLCAAPKTGHLLPDFTWLMDEGTPQFERHNLQLLLGRWMVRNRLYEEALEVLTPLTPGQVVDPAGLLFLQAVVNHQLLKSEQGMAAIERLLERPLDIPKRYVSLARLMESDLRQLKDESLDHISRRMNDVERRLELGRPGPKTREVEDGIIESLDKIIEELEKQAAAAAAAAGSGGGSMRPTSPAQDSTPMGGKGPGQVARKDIGNSSGWGDLPPKDRQEALQQIGKEFPGHYRDMIEQYFRKLATDEETP
jgi:hypothetical protein